MGWLQLPWPLSGCEHETSVTLFTVCLELNVLPPLQKNSVSSLNAPRDLMYLYPRSRPVLFSFFSFIFFTMSVTVLSLYSRLSCPFSSTIFTHKLVIIVAERSWPKILPPSPLYKNDRALFPECASRPGVLQDKISVTSRRSTLATR